MDVTRKPTGRRQQIRVQGQNCRGHFLLVLTEYDVTVLLSPNPAKMTAEADISFCTSLPTALLVPCS